MSGEDPGGLGRKMIWLILSSYPSRPPFRPAVHESEVAAGRADIGEQELMGHPHPLHQMPGVTNESRGGSGPEARHELRAELARDAVRERDGKGRDRRVAEQDHPLGGADLLREGGLAAEHEVRQAGHGRRLSRGRQPDRHLLVAGRRRRNTGRTGSPGVRSSTCRSTPGLGSSRRGSHRRGTRRGRPDCSSR